VLIDVIVREFLAHAGVMPGYLRHATTCDIVIEIEQLRDAESEQQLRENTSITNVMLDNEKIEFAATVAECFDDYRFIPIFKLDIFSSEYKEFINELTLGCKQYLNLLGIEQSIDNINILLSLNDKIRNTIQTNCSIFFDVVKSFMQSKSINDALFSAKFKLQF